MTLRKRYLGLIVLALAGCASEPSPTVGDAKIAQGIERKPGIKLRRPESARPRVHQPGQRS